MSPIQNGALQSGPAVGLVRTMSRNMDRTARARRQGRGVGHRKHRQKVFGPGASLIRRPTAIQSSCTVYPVPHQRCPHDLTGIVLPPCRPVKRPRERILLLSRGQFPQAIRLVRRAVGQTNALWRLYRLVARMQVSERCESCSATGVGSGKGRRPWWLFWQFYLCCKRLLPAGGPDPGRQGWM